MAVRPPALGRVSISGAGALGDYRASQRVDAHARRGSASARGYGRRWQSVRRTLLMREPLCRASRVLDGREVAAEVVDHWYPHCGLSWLFWDKRFWVPMSKAWHDGPKQRIENGTVAELIALGAELGVPDIREAAGDVAVAWESAFRLGRNYHFRGGGRKSRP